MESNSVHIPSIHCNHCVVTIQRELGELEGVSKVAADLDSKSVTVEWSPPADWDAIVSLLTEINYPPEQ
jgi:copper chaperone